MTVLLCSKSLEIGRTPTSNTAHCTLHTTHCTLHTAHCTLHTAHYTLHTTHYTLHTTPDTPNPVAGGTGLLLTTEDLTINHTR